MVPSKIGYCLLARGTATAIHIGLAAVLACCDKGFAWSFIVSLPLAGMGVENPRIGVSFFVVAHTANLIAGFRIEGSLFQRRVRARPRPPVSGFFYCSLGGRLHNLLTERSAVLPLNVPQLLAPIGWMRRQDAVRGVGGNWFLEGSLWVPMDTTMTGWRSGAFKSLARHSEAGAFVRDSLQFRSGVSRGLRA